MSSDVNLGQKDVQLMNLLQNPMFSSLLKNKKPSESDKYKQFSNVYSSNESGSAVPQGTDHNLAQNNQEILISELSNLAQSMAGSPQNSNPVIFFAVTKF
jgi:hypothetical protein